MTPPRSRAWQPRKCPCALAFDRADANLKRSGNLVFAEVVQIAQDDHLSLLAGQPAQCTEHPVTFGYLTRDVSDGWAIRKVIAGLFR